MTPRLWLIVGAVVLLLVGAGAIYLEGRSSGGNVARVDQLKKTNETQRSITDADAHGPRTPDDVDRRLRDGSF